MILYLECRSYGIALDIPTTRDEAASTIFSLIAGFEDEPAEISISGVNSPIPKLNQLAETIDGMNAAEHYHLSKSLDPESQQSLDDVLRIAAHIKPTSLDCYEVIPGVTSHQELGRWLVEAGSVGKGGAAK